MAAPVISWREICEDFRWGLTDKTWFDNWLQNSESVQQYWTEFQENCEATTARGPDLESVVEKAYYLIADPNFIYDLEVLKQQMDSSEKDHYHGFIVRVVVMEDRYGYIDAHPKVLRRIVTGVFKLLRYLIQNSATHESNMGPNSEHTKREISNAQQAKKRNMTEMESVSPGTRSPPNPQLGDVTSPSLTRKRQKIYDGDREFNNISTRGTATPNNEPHPDEMDVVMDIEAATGFYSTNTERSLGVDNWNGKMLVFRYKNDRQ